MVRHRMTKGVNSPKSCQTTGTFSSRAAIAPCGYIACRCVISFSYVLLSGHPGEAGHQPPGTAGGTGAAGQPDQHAGKRAGPRGRADQQGRANVLVSPNITTESVWRKHTNSQRQAGEALTRPSPLCSGERVAEGRERGLPASPGISIGKLYQGSRGRSPSRAINFGARNIAGFAGDARRFRKHTTKESN